MRWQMTHKLKTGAAAALVGVLALSACSVADSDTGGGGDTIDLVAYSTPESAYNDIEKKFQETDEGDGVEFSASYGPSGDQSRAVEGGQPADFVNFSLDHNLTVSADWRANDNLAGTVTLGQNLNVRNNRQFSVVGLSRHFWIAFTAPSQRSFSGGSGPSSGIWPSGMQASDGSGSGPFAWPTLMSSVIDRLV